LAVAPADATADNLRITAARAALPDAAFRVTLSAAYPFPTSLRDGEKASLHVLVKNSSGTAWPAASQPDGRYQIRLGNHWIDQHGQVNDDARADLPYDLAPGDTAEVLIIVRAPDNPGAYLLEFDLVQEQVSWFGQMGSPTLKTTVTVE
jgi:hypothetical protein